MGINLKTFALKTFALGCAALCGLACSATDPANTAGAGRKGSKQVVADVELTAAEAESSCEYRIGVVNHLPNTIRNLVVTLSPPPPGTPGDSVYLLCPQSDGVCSAKVVQSDATAQIAACSFILSSGDDFACRVQLNQDTVHATLSGANDAGGSVAASADARSSVSCDGNPPPPDGNAAARFRLSCEDDPVYRFEVVNTGNVTLRQLTIIPSVNLPNPIFVPKLCPDGDGGCTVVPVLADAIHQHAECEFTLSPGDDFACRVSFDPTTVSALLFGVGDNGERIELNSSATCEPTTPL